MSPASPHKQADRISAAIAAIAAPTGNSLSRAWHPIIWVLTGICAFPRLSPWRLQILMQLPGFSYLKGVSSPWWLVSVGGTCLRKLPGLLTQVAAKLENSESTKSSRHSDLKIFCIQNTQFTL